MNKEKIKQWITFSRIKHLRMHIRSSDDIQTWIKRVFLVGVIFGVFILIWFFGFFIPRLPDVGNIENLMAAQTSEILDREGGLLYRIYGGENRENVPLDKISQEAINAVLSIEDDQFYDHPGIDVPGIIKAICAELGACSARGGSTITQQFIKNAFLSPERTYTRKLKEIILALQLERRFEKNQILEMYLNRIPYGSNIYGIERASNIFFGKSASDLTIAEGAILASIPKAPTFYSPYGNNKYATTSITADEIFKKDIKIEQDIIDIDVSLLKKGLLGKTYLFSKSQGLIKAKPLGDDDKDKKNKPVEIPNDTRSLYLKGRVDFVLGRMKELGYINESQRITSLKEAETIEFKEFREEIVAPHFVMFVRQYLEEKYGKDQVEQGGLRVTTTIDPKLQDFAENAVGEFAEQNLARYDASNASLVAINPDNGQVLSMVGSVDYWNDEIDGKVNVALRPRLPGSSFKPIVYASAFLQGYAPSTVLYDVPTKFGAWYEPENYDGKYRGPVSMKQALAHSLNIPAVKAGYLAGIPNVLDLARKMGIQLDQPNDWYGLSLALGAGEARLIDMVQAYGVFASGGYKVSPVSILKIEDRNGNILEEYEGSKAKELILDPQVAYLINQSLSDVQARPEGWWRQQLSISGQINAAKTGTSNKKKKVGDEDINYPFDTWTIGYTRRLVAGVWAGNNDGRYLNLKASGLDTAGRIWNRFMTEATKDMPRESFDKPEGIKFVKISEKTGKLPSKYTPVNDIKTEMFANFSVPTEVDDSYRLVEIDKVSGKLATEYTPKAAIEKKAFFEHHAIIRENANWEESVRQWARENGQDEVIPTEYDDVHTPDTIDDRPELVIKTPVDLSTISPPVIGVLVDVNSRVGTRYVEYFWDDKLIYTAKKPPFKGVINIPKNSKVGSKHKIKAIVYDALLRSNQSSITVKIGKDSTPPQVEFLYPPDNIKLFPNSSFSTEVSAWDADGDIKKVEFYLNGKLKGVVKKPPYSWQLLVPNAGKHELKAIVYDYADNKVNDTLSFEIKDESNSVYSKSGILIPRDNESFNKNERVVIKVGLSDEVARNLKELTILSKKKGQKRAVEIINWKNKLDESVSNEHSFVWPNPSPGVYELKLKAALKDGRSRISKPVSIVVK